MKLLAAAITAILGLKLAIIWYTNTALNIGDILLLLELAAFAVLTWGIAWLDV